MSIPILKREITQDEHLALKQLDCCRFLPASFDKRFVRQMQSATQISERGAAQLWRIFKRYRRQMSFPDKARLLALADTLAAPDLRKQSQAIREQQQIDALKLAHAEAVKV